MKNTDAARMNPCLKEQEQTYKCFHKNNFDKEACQLHIENYKSCKSFWNFVKSERMRKGIRPALPPVEEREQIKQEYMSRFSTS
ncbi:coiled-coil-helix-coiled-coil-helix domain-containing protein 7 [Tribolium castaneum]|uniref:Coiled-coil-helix-coiled-coil-helix domain-containing protein 7 n=1 Tax=Tribolium castaneum TaxID=7070 RepID=A0A139WEX3_TRICA|nr:PREDICTED: coiled-coil-helix-coiled-coil-helix domain-containing protein 7 [Tribolium castaneum]KYB26462.1 Coiled-coil-helix-coiled-coil-helix domain-containing protein 7-like Protein [Tribolium castaneum]|eukprot:XP_974281.1 PREDICTED: coiled-coil-helix-coiled-coil-helix domain-containing protein 7 [Tribolium castaneum]